MADNPNQIDISLSLLGADSPAILTSLVQTLQNIEKTMSGVQSTMSSYDLPSMGSPLATADGSGASRPTAAESPLGQRRLPSTAPDSVPTTSDYYTQADDPDQAFFLKKVAAKNREVALRSKVPDVMEDGTAPQAIFVGGPADSGQLPQPTAIDETSSFFDGIQQRLASATHEVGGFTSAFGSHPKAMLGVMGDLVQQGVAGVWNGMRGVTPGADTNPGIFGQAKNIGINLAGAPWVFQNMMKVLPTTLPMLADPSALAQMGGDTGRGTIGPGVGPFSIPYLSAGGGFGANQVVQSFWEGLTTAGLSGKQALNIRQNLSQLGWAGQDSQGDLDRMARTVENIVKGNKAFDIPTTAAMLDKSMRWGGSSLHDFQKTLQAMPRAAQEAKMSLSEFQKAVADTAGIATQAGADYFAGVKNTQNFSQMTGLPPQLYGQFLQNPWMQANMMGTTGALPWEQGLLGPDTVMQSGVNVANMLTKTFENARPNGLTYRDASGRLRHISSFMTGTAGAAHVLGMSPQELRKMERSQNLLPARARAWDDLGAYTKEAGHPGAWNRITRDVLAGKYADNKHGQVQDRLNQIYKSTNDPQKRANELRAQLEKWTANIGGTSKDPNQVVVSLAGDASRYLRLNTPKQQNKLKVNAGSESTANRLGMPGTPGSGTFDPYTPPPGYSGW